jgi:tellurite resistance protein TehA-like permease
MNLHGLPRLSLALLWISIAAWFVLIVLNIVRVVISRDRMLADFTDPARAFGFFTFVAGTDVVGTRITTTGHHTIALLFLAIGWAAWLALGYIVPWTAVLGRSERPVIATANGTWFIWTVASQSVAVLASALEPTVGVGRRDLALLAIFSWSVGAFLYCATGIFVAARLLLYPFGPSELTPPYWVSMGATAITVLAGARIVEMSNPVISATRGLVAGASLVFWAFGTWLIPALLAAGLWRHWVHGIPLRYEASWWSAVFPLGMYGGASYYLGRADNLSIVQVIGEHEMWLALGAWAFAFGAMTVHVWRTVVVPDREQATFTRVA